MPRWVEIADASNLAPGEARECFVEDRIVALFNVDGTLHALDGMCPHQGGPLGKGCLTGTTITCPWHGWQFDVTTGQHKLSPRIIQSRFPVELREGKVFLGLE